MTQRITAAAAILLSISLAGLSFAQGSTADLYKTKCQMCHGADGKGNTPMGPKLGVRDFHSPVVAKESDQMLFDITKNGKNKMPPYNGKLTDDQIKDLVKYIRSLK
ncbi:MAG TPA: cytochrome c [Terracidiphilus sp.]|jgi:mono/diheme cytochrome c family protein